MKLKSDHLWSMAEDFTREGRWPESDDDDTPNDFNTPDFVVRAMLDDLKLMKSILVEKGLIEDESPTTDSAEYAREPILDAVRTIGAQG